MNVWMVRYEFAPATIAIMANSMTCGRRYSLPSARRGSSISASKVRNGVNGSMAISSPWNSVSVRKPDLEIIGFLSRRRRHLERSPSGTRLCSQPENANFLSEMFPDRHSIQAVVAQRPRRQPDIESVRLPPLHQAMHCECSERCREDDHQEL